MLTATRTVEWKFDPTTVARIERRIFRRVIAHVAGTLAVFVGLAIVAVFAFDADSFGLYSAVSYMAWNVGMATIMAALVWLFWMGCIHTIDGWHDWKDFKKYGYESILRLK